MGAVCRVDVVGEGGAAGAVERVGEVGAVEWVGRGEVGRVGRDRV